MHKENEENTQIFKFINKLDEIKFFLREYNFFQNEKYDYYYLIPFEWILSWDIYITDTKM